MPPDPPSRSELRALIADENALEDRLSELALEQRGAVERCVAERRSFMRELKRLPDAIEDQRARSVRRKELKRAIGDSERALADLLAPSDSTGAEASEAGAPRPARAARSSGSPRALASPDAIRIVATGEADAWDAYVARHPQASAYHAWAWRGILADSFGHDTEYLVACDAHDEGSVVGVLPTMRLRSRLFGDFVVSLPYVTYGGPLAESEDIADALCREAWNRARGQGSERIEFRCTAPLPEWRVREDKVSMVKLLPEDRDALWCELPSKLRSQIRRPLELETEFHVGGEELLEEFYEVFATNMRDLGTPVYAMSFFRNVLRGRPDDGRLAVLRWRDRPVSAGLLLRHRGRMEIPWASSLRRYNKESMNMLFYWRVLSYSCEAGCDSFDFGRSSRDAGTFRFKRQWGAAPQRLHWLTATTDQAGDDGGRLSPTNPRFSLAIAAWKRLPVPLAKLIGPPIVRNLP